MNDILLFLIERVKNQFKKLQGETRMEYVTQTVCRDEAKHEELRRPQERISAWQIHCSHYHWDRNYFSAPL